MGFYLIIKGTEPLSETEMLASEIPFSAHISIICCDQLAHTQGLGRVTEESAAVKKFRRTGHIKRCGAESNIHWLQLQFCYPIHLENNLSLATLKVMSDNLILLVYFQNIRIMFFIS